MSCSSPAATSRDTTSYDDGSVTDLQAPRGYRRPESTAIPSRRGEIAWRLWGGKNLTDHVSPEAEYGQVIERAMELAGLARAIFGPPPATLTGPDRVLWATLRGLLRDELSMFEAIVAITATPGALAAEPLVRSILEGYANVLWVVNGIGDARGNTPQVRALCFQLGAAKKSVADLDSMEK